MVLFFFGWLSEMKRIFFNLRVHSHNLSSEISACFEENVGEVMEGNEPVRDSFFYMMSLTRISIAHCLG